MKFVMIKLTRFMKISANVKTILHFSNSHLSTEYAIKHQKFAKTLIQLHSLHKLNLLIRDFKNP